MFLKNSASDRSFGIGAAASTSETRSEVMGSPPGETIAPLFPRARAHTIHTPLARSSHSQPSEPYPMLPRAPFSRLVLSAAVGGLCLLLASRTPIAAVEVAPTPHTSPGAVDRALIAEIKARSELMKNLEYLSDRIGG